MPLNQQQIYKNRMNISLPGSDNLALVVAAMQQGAVGGVNNVPTSQGFGSATVPFDAQNIAFVDGTTDATAGDPATTTYAVPGSPATFTGTAWVVQGNGYVIKDGLSYSDGTLTITIESTGESQSLVVAVWNGSNSNSVAV